MPDESLALVKSDPECNEFVLETSGSAFKEVLGIEGVDAYRTYTNRFTEVHSVLGIEAARTAIFKELTKRALF